MNTPLLMDRERDCNTSLCGIYLGTIREQETEDNMYLQPSAYGHVKGLQHELMWDLFTVLGLETEANMHSFYSWTGKGTVAGAYVGFIYSA